MGRSLSPIVLFTVPANEPPSVPQGVGFMPNDLAGKWVWEWALSLIEFIPKGHQKAADNRPWHLSMLTDERNNYKDAYLRALKCETDRIKRLDLPTEVI